MGGAVRQTKCIFSFDKVFMQRDAVAARCTIGPEVDFKIGRTIKINQ